MTWWEKILAKARQYETTNRTTDRALDWDGEEMTPELELRQPFSDGSEEFFGEFMPRDDQRWQPDRQVLIGLGITIGVLAGIGIAIWLIKNKHAEN
ncbi:MAG: hypothetical protein ONB44_17860 [candidate division KSB1 bacterium]|nr:hypothetical protein [candidate division KSB1 bacterium]MDZ7303993.1 hypothetical protein [candidate division KSB1 bacterium]MDZ7313297.1 hypothetical protein [candidate division KSB1 bacterium]